MSKLLYDIDLKELRRGRAHKVSKKGRKFRNRRIIINEKIDTEINGC